MSTDKSPARVRAMFGSIAHRYDFLNHLLSLNIDRWWRSFTVKTIKPAPGTPILDCCTGTCDLALAMDHVTQGANPIIGVDFTPELLRIGLTKTQKKQANQRIQLIQGDALRIPTPDNTFSVVMVAFGLRNIVDTAGGLDEMIRAAQPGGSIAILEFSKPQGKILGNLYLLFFKKILPKVGQTVAPNRYSAYSYLPQSVLEFPDGQAMLDLMASRGLQQLRQYPLTLGIATLYVGVKS